MRLQMSAKLEDRRNSRRSSEATMATLSREHVTSIEAPKYIHGCLGKVNETESRIA